MLKKILMGSLLLVVITIFGGCFVIFYLPELLIKNIIHIPSSTKLMYDTEKRYGANAGTRSIYYLSDQNIDDLSNWYKDFYSPFWSGSPQKEWLITVKATDSRALNANGLNADASKLLTDESLCSYQYLYTCLTVAMVDLSIHYPPSGYITSDNGFAPESDTPLYAMLEALPKSGTLIIYRYYVFDG